ncbi:MAG: sulfotransferase family 2 domain-containing protein [Acidimicrobiia bacterium]
MIVSFEHEFIFMKVPKTAGTSVEVFLSQVAGASAIVTPIGPPEAGHEARNYESTSSVVVAAYLHSMQGRAALTRTYRTIRGKRPLYFNHMSAQLVKDRIGARRWNRFFKFGFERNPWDKTISSYFWETRKAEVRPPFVDWVLTPGNLKSDRRLYTIDNQVAVDFIGRYETLETDLRVALERAGVTTPIELPRAKGKVRRTDARIAITAAADAVIQREFRTEIEQFGYTRPPEIPWE